MIQHVAVFSHFLKPLHRNIYKLYHQALMVMKIKVEDFAKIVTFPHFLHLTSMN